MEKFFADTESVLLQTGDESHHGCRSLGFQVDVFTVDVEEHSAVAQCHLCQGIVVHNIEIKR